MNVRELVKIKPDSLGLVKGDGLREAYIDLLSSQPTRYHLTLTFLYGVHEKVAVNLLNKFLKYLNRAILKGRYDRAGEYIKGFAIKESTPSMDNVHFHITLSDAEWLLPEKQRMEVVIERKILSANRTVSPVNSIATFYLQCYVKGSLENYLTKNFGNNFVSLNDKIDCICPLGHEGVSFGA